MSKYSEQDLKYAAEFREEIHKGALGIVQKTRPNITQVVDRHPIEDYFQEKWDYPGKWYTIVAVPYGYSSRKALVDTIVRDTLSGSVLMADTVCAQELQNAAKFEHNRLTDKPKKVPKEDQDPFYSLIAEYPDLVVDYCIVKNERYYGYESHRKALKTAYGRICSEWEGDPGQALGKIIEAGEMFSSEYRRGRLNYRQAFLNPPHKNCYTGKDFVRVNSALFPKGTDELEVYEWSTEWSDYFDDGHEWWGTLCLTVYDKPLDRFVVIMASATD